MSTVRVRSLAATTTTSPEETVQRLVSVSIEGLRDLGQRLAEVLAPAVSESPKSPRMRASKRRCGCGCCDIPEQECPPRCVCEICWEATGGEELTCTVRVRNASSRTRTFDLSATELTGPAGTLPELTVTPAQLTLAPDRSGLAQGTLALPEDAAEGTYEGEILIHGAYEQCVRVQVTVKGTKKCTCGQRECCCRQPCCMCEVVQGDPPLRIRAHYWYDHFQCTEGCECVARESEHA
jgi:hypothetical protein